MITICVHEYGHFKYASKRGLNVPIFSIGFKFKLPTILKFKLKRYPGTVFLLNPIPMGGYVKIDENELNDLTPDYKVEILQAGIRNNLLLAGFSFFILLAMRRVNILTNVPSEIYFTALLIVAGLIFVAIWSQKIFPKLKSFFNWVVIPALGFVFFFYIIKSIIDVKSFFPQEGQGIGDSATEKLGGVITAYKVSREIFGSFGFREFLMWLSLINLSVGLFNILPIYPLDGGHVFVEILKKIQIKNWAIILFKALGLIVMTFFIVMSLTSDGISLFEMITKPGF